MTPTLILILLFLLAPPTALYIQGRLMSQPERYLKNAPEAAEDVMQKLNEQQLRWLSDLGCEPVGAYRLFNIKLVAWKVPDTSTSLMIIDTGGKLVSAFDTLFEKNNDLTTSNTRAVFAEPLRPGEYQESFPIQNLDELYNKHLYSIDVLQTQRGVVPLKTPFDFYETIIKDMRASNAFKRSRLFWPFRYYYRFFVTRHKMFGQSVEQQLNSEKPF